MKIIFLGATAFSAEMLLCLLNNGINVSALFMIPKEFDLKKKGEQAAQKYDNANFSDLGEIARQYQVPCYTVDSRQGRTLGSYADIIEQIAPDLILVLGWYYLVPKRIRDLAVHGALGIHASLLPKYAGGSPLVWALLHGETKTGITMFRFEDGVDDGDILAQSEIDIDCYDTIRTLYDKVTVASKAMLISELNKIKTNSHRFTPQDKNKIHPLPIRTPGDGIINWDDTAMNLYNFVRAQTKPYPCAYSFLDGKKIKLVSMEYPREVMNDLSGLQPGEVFEKDEAVLVKCRDAAVHIVTVDVDDTELDFSAYCRATDSVGQSFSNNSLGRKHV